jgi:predicted AAA+ superfamily ATPase
MYKRIISLDQQVSSSFFLWGPRQTGKSSLLRERFPNAYWIDLLDTQEFIKFQNRPAALREEVRILPRGAWVIIDEVQKVPLLLDEIHNLIEKQGLRFGLCGSSARKIRRGHANLLGGRAFRFELTGLVSEEMKTDLDLHRMINFGFLPRYYELAKINEKDALRGIKSYCSDYLKEEIAAEGLIRNLPQFSRFLETAALSDTEQLNFATIARDCGVSAPTIKSYYEILEDTLMGTFLPAYQKRPRRRIVTTPKFYFGNIGLVNILAKRGTLEPGSELFGKAFENWIYHELRSYCLYTESDLELSYWRLSTGVEIDFILGKMDVAIECKSSNRIHSDHLKGLRELKIDHSDVKKRIVVCLEERIRITDDEILVMPYQEFLKQLWSGAIIK